MSHFPIHTIESAPDASAELLDSAKKRFGAVPNLLGVLAGSPVALKAYLTLSELFSTSSLTSLEQQVVLLTVSFENRCDYCMAAHSMLALHAGGTEAVVTALREGKSIPDPRLEGLARFARSVVRERGWLEKAELARFLEAGYTAPQALEVLVGVAQKTLSNYTNHLAATPLDEMFRGHAWTAPQTAAESSARR